MKKGIIIAGLLLAMANTAFAEQWGVFMEFHRKSNPEKNMSVNRAENGGYPPTQNGDIRSLFMLFTLMAMQY